MVLTGDHRQLPEIEAGGAFAALARKIGARADVAEATDRINNHQIDRLANLVAKFAKAGTRAAINTSPEPFSNWTASLAEDAVVPLGLWLAFAHPILFFLLLGLFMIGAVMLLRLIWRGLQRLLA